MELDLTVNFSGGVCEGGTQGWGEEVCHVMLITRFSVQGGDARRCKSQKRLRRQSDSIAHCWSERTKTNDLMSKKRGFY